MEKKVSIRSVRLLAEKRGVEVLSAKCPSPRTTLRFRCSCATEYSQRYTDFRRNSTGRCAGCNRPRGAAHPHSQPFTAAQRADRSPQARLASYRRFAKKVFDRDGNVCVITGSTEKLVAHHLNNWAQFPDQREDMGNGVTITKALHDEFHTVYGHLCTKDQFDRFVDAKRLLQLCRGEI